jgi:hypothetical protein
MLAFVFGETFTYRLTAANWSSLASIGERSVWLRIRKPAQWNQQNVALGRVSQLVATSTSTRTCRDIISRAPRSSQPWKAYFSRCVQDCKTAAYPCAVPRVEVEAWSIPTEHSRRICMITTLTDLSEQTHDVVKVDQRSLCTLLRQMRTGAMI